MHSIVILMTLLAMAVGQGTTRSCEESCRSPLPSQSPTTTALNCKCFEIYMEWLKAHQSQNMKPYSKDPNAHQAQMISYTKDPNAHQPQMKTYTKDPNAIYYKPGENVVIPNRQPGYSLYSSLPEISPYHNNVPKHHKNIPNRAYQPMQYGILPYEPNTYSKIKRKDSDYGVYIGSNYAPLYLDVNLNVSSGSEETILNYLYHKKIRDITEKHLKDCLDLHVILQYRNHSNGTQLNNILSEGNKIYNKLKDKDLVIEINNKCKQPATIVNESIEEIKQNQPHSKNRNITAEENEYPFQQSQTTEISFEDMNKYQDPYRSLNRIPEMDPKNYMSTVSKSAISTELTPSTTWNNKADKNTTELFNGASVESTSIMSPTDDPVSDAYSIESNSLLYIDVSDDVTTPSYIRDTTPTSNTDTTADTLVSFHGDVLITTSKIYSTDLNIDSPDSVTQTHNFGEDMTSVDTVATTDHATVIDSELSDHVPDKTSTPFSNQISLELINQETSTETEDIKNNNNLEMSTANSANSSWSNNSHEIKRLEYLEGEYDIPKVMTAELSNDTIVSEVKGMEEIPNLDFVKLDVGVLLQDRKTNDSIIEADKSDKTNCNFSSSSMSHDNLISTKRKPDASINITEDSVDIAGNIFFKYRQFYVPAKFVQKPDGQIDVALDLLTVCKSNKITKKKSKLLEVLCKCIESNNDYKYGL